MQICLALNECLYKVRLDDGRIKGLYNFHLRRTETNFRWAWPGNINKISATLILSLWKLIMILTKRKAFPAKNVDGRVKEKNCQMEIFTSLV